MLDIAVLILTYNEEIHIERTLRNVLPFAKEIFLVDSYSTDRTAEIAESLGAKVYRNKWENNYAKQLNWGLSTLPVTARWVLRLDADEYLTEELIGELECKLPALEEDVTGVILHHKHFFFGRLMHPLKLLRLFRYGHGQCEQRWMDEHIQLLDGRAVEFEGMFIDHNLNNLGWWIAKHNGYSIREAIDLLDLELGILPAAVKEGQIGAEALEKRRKKAKYAHSPLFWRSFSYFVYRFVFRFGFAKGKAQFLWDFFQGWWYRTLVDAKIYEIKRACGTDKEKILDYIRDSYGIDCRKV